MVTNTGDLLKLDPDNLKQYSRNSCLVISGVKLPQNKINENAEEMETEVGKLFSRKAVLNEDIFEYKQDKVHRLLLKSTK